MKTLFRSGIRSLTVLAFFAAIISINNSCEKSSDSPGPNEVFIKGMAFSPGTITVSVNTTITWFNKDNVAHTVTSTTGLFDSGTISSAGGYGGGGTFTHTFATAGSFPYHCTIHPSMNGTVIVN